MRRVSPSTNEPNDATINDSDNMITYQINENTLPNPPNTDPAEIESQRQTNNQIQVFRYNKCRNCCCKNGIIHKIIKKHTTLNRLNSLFFSYMVIMVSVYLSCEALQLSPLIAPPDHYTPTVSAYAYNLVYVWLTTYFLLKQQNIVANDIPDSVFYWTMCHIGGIGFALLGEVPFLRNIVIVQNFWKDLTINAWVTIIIIGSVIIYIGIWEAVDSIVRKRCKKSLINILLVAVSYIYILVLLHVNQAKYIHFHVHHAIFAGILSTWFTTWNNCLEMGMHAILMGVVVEGIDFYGIGELSLFMVKGTTMMTFPIALGVASIYGGIVLFLYSISNC